MVLPWKSGPSGPLFHKVPPKPHMPRKRPVKLRCPICKKATKAVDPDFPFCSDRCRLIDLGKWASGGYLISSPVTDAEEAIRQDSVDDEDGD